MTDTPFRPAIARQPLGDYVFLALHDGLVARDLPPGFIVNRDDAETALALRQAGMPAGKMVLSFTVFALEREGRVVLFDAGFGPHGPPSAGRLQAALAAAGHGLEAVERIFVTHFHADHVWGLIDAEGAPAFPAARVMVPRPEWDYWMDDAQMAAAPEGRKPAFELARKVFGALGDRVELLDWNDEPMPGVHAVALPGHTPGMTGYRITSQGASVFYVADVCNTPVVFARHPDWEVMFDMDGAAATRTRLQVFAEAAASHELLAFCHAPFPAIGTLAPMGERYAWCPQVWG